MSRVKPRSTKPVCDICFGIVLFRLAVLSKESVFLYVLLGSSLAPLGETTKMPYSAKAKPRFTWNFLGDAVAACLA